MNSISNDTVKRCTLIVYGIYTRMAVKLGLSMVLEPCKEKRLIDGEKKLINAIEGVLRPLI